jgi:hypothetical protein
MLRISFSLQPLAAIAGSEKNKNKTVSIKMLKNRERLGKAGTSLASNLAGETFAN